MGLLPKAVGDALQVANISETTEEMITAKGPSVVRALESVDSFRNLINDGKDKIVCKFTARYGGLNWRLATNVSVNHLPSDSPIHTHTRTLSLALSLSQLVPTLSQSATPF